MPDGVRKVEAAPILPASLPRFGVNPRMNIQRWTLAVVCAATAMLMLDIAVVNTALSRIAEDLDAGLSGLQWVVDAYTLALATTVLTAGSLADRFGRRRLFTVGLALFTVASRPVRAASRHRDPQQRARRAGRRRGDHVRRLAGDPRQRVPGREGAGRRAGRLRRDDRRLVRHRPARRRRAHQRPGLAVDLPRQHPDRRCSACGSPAARSRSRATRTPRRIDWPGQATLTAGLFLLVLGAAARQRGRLEEHADRRRARRRRRAAGRVRGRRARASKAADAPAEPVPQRLVHRCADRGVRDLGVVLRRLPLHDAVPAAGARAVGDRGRPRLPAGHDHHTSSSPARPPARREGLGRGRWSPAAWRSSPSAWR